MTKTIVGMTEQEAEHYIQMIREKNPKREIEWINITADGEFAEVTYKLKDMSFERLRRITGYLVGTMGRWNDGKRAEEADRVKHL